MNKEQFERELDNKLALMKKEIMQKFEKEKEQEQDFPKNGDDYWYLQSTGTVGHSNWDNLDVEEHMLTINNIFQSEEEAEFECEKRKVIAELKRYEEPKDREWGNNKTLHYHIMYDYELDAIYIDKNWILKDDVIYFESLEKTKEAVEKVGIDRVCKYLFNV